MPYRGHNAKICRVCERHVAEVGRLSARYKCAGCGDTRVIENLHQLEGHAGPWFDHWRRQTLAAFGVFLPAEPAEAEESRAA